MIFGSFDFAKVSLCNHELSLFCRRGHHCLQFILLAYSLDDEDFKFYGKVNPYLKQIHIKSFKLCKINFNKSYLRIFLQIYFTYPK